jgi:hypothetical protein
MLLYLRFEFVGIWMYVRLLVLPWHQAIAHNVSGLVSLSVLAAIAPGATCVLTYGLRARAPPLQLRRRLVPAAAGSLIEHRPARARVAEHRVYLARMGFFLIAGTLVASLHQRLRWRPVGLLVGLSAAGIFALIGFVSLTMSRIVVWADPVALWREAAITAPRYDTYTGLGNALRDADNCQRALVAYRIAS